MCNKFVALIIYQIASVFHARKITGGMILSEKQTHESTPFTNEHFMAFCEKMLGQPYWYGTCLYKATNRLLSRKTSQYPSSYATSRMARYRQDVAAKKVVAGCFGAAK